MENACRTYGPIQGGPYDKKICADNFELKSYEHVLKFGFQDTL